MPTAIELRQEYEAEVKSLDAWLAPRKTEDGYNFDPNTDDTKSFNDQNAALAVKHDAYTEQRNAELAIAENEAREASLKSVNRLGIFAPQLAGGTPGALNVGNPYAASGAEIKTLGQMFIESDEYKSNSEKSPSIGQWKAEIEQGSVGDSLKALSLSSASGVLPYPMARPGIVDFPTRRPAMRNIVPVEDPQGALIQFIRQNVQIFSADIVPEGALKPQTILGNERVVLQVEAIAHYLQVPDQALRFIPGIQSMIDRKGTQGIMLAEDDKMLNYDGAAGWKGFLKQTGVQVSARGAQDQFTAFHQGMNLIMFTGFGNVTGAVMHNNDWHKLVTTKDTTGRFIYGDPSQTSPEPRIWGKPITVTPVMTEGTVLAGDFDANSKWWVAGGIIIKVGYVNDDLIRNQQTIVVEEYGALEIDIPQTFVRMTGWETIPAN